MGWQGEVITPDDVLYVLDGPAIFLKKIGPFTFLFVKVDEKDTTDFFVASQIGRKQVEYLKSGKLSVRGALVSGDLWVFELDLDLTVVKYREVSEKEVQAYLPRHGVGLQSNFGLVPDSIDQTEANFAFKFFGDELSEEGMPLSTLKGLLDNVYNTLRHALTPNSLGKGRASTVLDFPVRPLQFASLLIAVDAPEIDMARFRRGKLTKKLNADEVLAESSAMGADFAQHLVSTVEAFRKENLTEKFADDNLDFLLALVEILPNKKGDVRRMQFSANNVGGKDLFVDIDLITAEKIRASVKDIDNRLTTLHGFISGILDGSNTLIIKTRYSREVTCRLGGEEYEEIKDDGNLVIGKPIIVDGYFTKRARRDLMDVEGHPKFP